MIADEQNDRYSYIRSDLSTAYNHGADTTDLTPRTLDYFYRSFAYLREPNIFVVYDQTNALKSKNSRGEYRKHLRWHFPNKPTVSGQTLTVDQGTSRLKMSFLLPETAMITPVDENSNPDPCDGVQMDCSPYGFNSGTWRVKVKDGAGSLTTPFLTVLQPTATGDQPMTAANLSSTDGTMIGTSLTVPGKGRYVMLFNNGGGQVPAPITTVIYSVANASNCTAYTLRYAARSTLYGFVCRSDSDGL